MLELPDIESAVRVGDVFAQLVEHYVAIRDYHQAEITVRRLQERGVALSPYIDRSMLEQIYGNVGLPMPECEPVQNNNAMYAGQHHGMEGDDDNVDEDIE